MNKLISIGKDFSISAIIAVLTANLISLPNVVYQIVIGLLILIILFLILRGLDRLSRRLEILSILYCENLIVPLVKATQTNQPIKLDDTLTVSKVKLFVVLPENQEDIYEIQQNLKQLKTYTIQIPSRSRGLFINGKVMGDQLLVFDTPLMWHMGIENLVTSKKLTRKQIRSLLIKMGQDIRKYLEKSVLEAYRSSVEFITMQQFNKYFN